MHQDIDFRCATRNSRSGIHCKLVRVNAKIVLAFILYTASTGMGWATTETVVHSFATEPKGAMPWAGVTLDSAGNLYGTTTEGGASNFGTVYKIDTTGHVTVLYSFAGGTDGATPYAGVVFDPTGDLYGTTR